MANLITSQQFKNAKGITVSTYDTQIDTLLPLVSNYIEEYCHRKFGIDTYTEKRRGVVDYEGRYVFHVKNSPINSITSVSLRFFGTTQNLAVDTTRLDIFEEAGYALYSWILNPSVSVIRAEYRNDFYYTITYNGGEAVPGAVQLACINALADTLDYYYGQPTTSGDGSVGTADKDFTIGDYTERNIGGNRSTFGSLHDTTTGIILTQTVKDLLAPFISYDQGW
jgi:hypothetical protein